MRSILKNLLFLITVLVAPLVVFGASLFSNYGQIQNVQNYSSNPFWSPNSPYNQRMPQAIYAQGADLTTEDCQKVVWSLVSAQCLARDNCKNTTLADIRPAVMIQLSSLPEHNYASSCAGFIDGMYDAYVSQYGEGQVKHVAFPNAVVKNPDVINGNVEFKNPYEIKVPKWQEEIIQRTEELEGYQSNNL